MPTFQEMAEGSDYKSKNSRTVLIDRLANRNDLKKSQGSRSEHRSEMTKAQKDALAELMVNFRENF